MSQRPPNPHALSHEAVPHAPAARPTGRRPRATRHPHPTSAASADDTGIFLGWEGDDPAARFGFTHPAGAAGPRARPVLYRGDSHLMTVAPTGAGKGVGVIIPNLLRYPGPVIVIDPKGENYQVTARRRRELGQRVVALDPFHVAARQSDALNPLDLCQLERSILECDAEMLASLLATGHELAREPYWDDTGRALLSGLIAHIMSNAEEDDCTLNQLRRFLYHDALDLELARLLDEGDVPNPLAHDEFVSYLAIPEDRTRPCVRSTATTYIKALGSPAVARTLGRSTFDLQDVVDGKPLTIYLIIPPEKLDSHRSLLRLWVGTLLTALATRRQLPRRRTLLLIDEAAQLGPLPALRQAITLHRGYGVQVHTFWQDLSQLRLLYERDWQTMINNSAALQVFGIANYQMARAWSDVIGQDPHELLGLKPDEALVHLPGEGSRRCRRASYLRDPAFAGLYDRNERFALLDERAPGR